MNAERYLHSERHVQESSILPLTIGQAIFATDMGIGEKQAAAPFDE